MCSLCTIFLLFPLFVLSELNRRGNKDMNRNYDQEDDSGGLCGIYICYKIDD